jgi:sulfite reductase alpha subunit-like flavoprotein
MPTAADENLVDYHNNVGSLEIEDDYYTGVASTDFIQGLTVKHKPANTVSSFFQFLPGTGNVYNKKSVPQLLQVMGARYFNKKPRTLKKFSHEANLLAKKIVDLFFSECMIDTPIEEVDLDTVASEFADSARKKKYESMFKGFDNMDVQTIRFHLKDIFKPKVAAVADPKKAGQGISAWSKDAQTTFGIGARLANLLTAKRTKPNVIYDNRITPVELKEKLTAAMGSIPATAKNGITDFTMFDSMQDEFTQAIEKHFMERLGFSEEFIEHYYLFRRNYKIIGGPIAGTSRYEKTSGEPMTLLMNTIISGCLSNYILRGDGDFLFAMKGDDGFKRQCNLKLDSEAYAEVTSYTVLRMKVDISNAAEFCGYVISDSVFVDSIPRKLHKLLSHHFSSYKHFCEYQQSIRDFISEFEDDEFFLANLRGNVAVYKKQGASMQEISSMFDVLKSFSHIDEDQFYASCMRVTFDSIYKSSNGPLIQYFDVKDGKTWKDMNPDI